MGKKSRSPDRGRGYILCRELYMSCLCVRVCVGGVSTPVRASPPCRVVTNLASPKSDPSHLFPACCSDHRARHL